MSNIKDYVEYRDWITRTDNRTQASCEHWLWLEQKIRKPSLDSNISNEHLGYFYLAILVKEKIINPLITTNWDSLFDKVAKVLRVEYAQNPCGIVGSEDWYDGYKNVTIGSMSSVRFWKVHGDIRYIFLPCCQGYMKLNPIMPFPQSKIEHVSCPRHGKIDSLSHHILEPRGSPVLFETEIHEATKEILEKSRTRGLAMILVLGFSGHEYEELVDPILTVAKNREIPVFYANPEYWETPPKLSAELKKIGGHYISKDCEEVLLQIVKSYGLLDKYQSYLNQYFERGSE